MSTKLKEKKLRKGSSNGDTFDFYLFFLIIERDSTIGEGAEKQGENPKQAQVPRVIYFK